MFDRCEKVREIVEQHAQIFRELEALRQNAISKRRKGFGLMGAAAVFWLIVLAVLASSGVNGIALIIIGLAGFGISFAILHSLFIGKYVKEYLENYKSRIFAEVARSIQAELQYRPNEGVPESLFKSVGLVKSRIDRYHSEDLFYGDVSDTEVYFSEVKAERKDTSRDSKGNTKTTWKTLFDGVFFMADFHKDFSTWATVTPDFAERTFGWLGKKLQKMGGSVIHLENPEFEKAFVVRGGDQVAVRYILTPDMQERLLKLRAALGDSVMLAFKDSKVVMLFATKKNWFEPDFKKPSDDTSQLERFVTEMQACCGVVEMMNLNTRIWTK